MQFLQANSSSNTGSASSLATTFNNPCQSGSLIVSVSFISTGGVWTVSDNVNAGNYSTAQNVSGGGNILLTTYFPNNQSTSASTVTINPGASRAYLMQIIAEFSGMATSSVLDQTNSGTSTSTTSVTTNNVTTTSPSELLIGAFVSAAGTGGAAVAGSGYTIPTNGNPRPGTQTLCLEYQFVSVTGTYNASLSWPSNATTTLGIITFIGTSATSSPGQLIYILP